MKRAFGKGTVFCFASICRKKRHREIVHIRRHYPYVYHAWLSQLLIFLVYKVSGLWGLTVIFTVALVASIFFLEKSLNLSFILASVNADLPTVLARRLEFNHAVNESK